MSKAGEAGEAGEAMELKSAETTMKTKLNNSIKKQLLSKTYFVTCMQNANNRELVFRLRIKDSTQHQYEIHYQFNAFFTDVADFLKLPNYPKIYAVDTHGGKSEVKDERKYNFAMFLLLSRLLIRESVEMVAPMRSGEVSVFDTRTPLLQTFKESYPHEPVNIMDDVFLDTPSILMKKGEDPCSVMGGKMKGKSKKRTMERKSKKRMRRKSKRSYGAISTARRN